MRARLRESRSSLRENTGIRRGGLIGAALIVFLFLSLMAIRGIVVGGILRGIGDCPACMGATAVQQDAPLLALLLVLVAMSFLTRRYWLQLPALLAAAALVLVYAVDVVVTKTLAFRLYVFDVLKFGREFGAIEQFGGLFVASTAGKIALAVAVALVIVLILALLPRPRRPRVAGGCFAAAIVCAAIGLWQPSTLKYIHYELLQNIVSANLALLGVNKPLSAGFSQQLAQEYKAPAELCENGQSERPDVIMLAVESLSMHHSLLFGGTRDLAPHVDVLAKRYTYLPDFFANGFTTDGGLISIVTGEPPVPSVGRYGSAEAFAGFDRPEGDLPQILHASGYEVDFFTTGDLGFLDKTAWLKTMQFDHWEGAEQPFYNGWKRRHFNAAEDKALYERFEQWLDARGDDPKPWFALMLTVSTHPPFINPETDQPDEAGAFVYADRQIGAFYDALQARGFFKHGILLISGDHRSMSPLHPGEGARFGDSALARVPMVVVTDLPIAHGAVAGDFQQTDILPSLADLTSAKACRTAAQGVFLRSQPQPADYVVHARGDRRNVLDVFFGKQQGKILLNGDATRWQGPKPANWQQIMDGILIARARRGPVKQNAFDVLLDANAAAARQQAAQKH